MFHLEMSKVNNKFQAQRTHSEHKLLIARSTRANNSYNKTN